VNEGQDVGELLRFLRAREFKIPATFKMYCEYLKWKREKKPELITKKDVMKQYNKGKLLLLPNDKHGRPTILLLGRNHLPGEADIEEVMDLIHFTLCEAVKRFLRHRFLFLFLILYRMPEGVEQVLFLYDRTGFQR